MTEMKNRSTLTVATANGETVTATTYRIDEDKAVRDDLAKYIQKKGVENAKKEFNELLDGWENRPIKQIIADAIKKGITVDYISMGDRILREATIKTWRSVFGQAVRKVLAGKA